MCVSVGSVAGTKSGWRYHTLVVAHVKRKSGVGLPVHKAERTLPFQPNACGGCAPYVG